MDSEILTERLFEKLITGKRNDARDLVSEAIKDGMLPKDVSQELFWPVLESVNTLYRDDQLPTLAQHYATRLLRSLVDQIQVGYKQKKRRNRTICMFCGPNEADELAAQLVADLAEADGYEVYFAGGGIANDEILAEIGELKPDILLLFASAPSDAPNIRNLIDTIRSVDACPTLQIVVGGGIFNRAPGLAEEIGADVWAVTPQDLLDKLVTQRNRRATPDQRTVGKNIRSGKAVA